MSLTEWQGSAMRWVKCRKLLGCKDSQWEVSAILAETRSFVTARRAILGYDCEASACRHTGSKGLQFAWILELCRQGVQQHSALDTPCGVAGCSVLVILIPEHQIAL